MLHYNVLKYIATNPKTSTAQESVETSSSVF